MAHDTQGSVDEAPAQERQEQIDRLQRELIDVASMMGQDGWLVSQTERRLPHPERGKDINEKQGHPFVMSGGTMRWVRETVSNVGDSFTANSVKEDFWVKIKADLDRLGVSEDKLKYLHDLSDEDVTNWMKTIATEGLAGNENWGKTLIGFFNKYDIDVTQVNSGEVALANNEHLQNLRDGILAIGNADSIGSIIGIFSEYPKVRVAMQIAHQNWRSKFLTLETLKPSDKTIEQMQADFQVFLQNVDFNVASLEACITQIRTEAHHDPSISSEGTFQLMIDIAAYLNAKLSTYTAGDAKLKAVKSNLDSIVQTLLFDANPVLIDAINVFSGNAEQV